MSLKYCLIFLFLAAVIAGMTLACRDAAGDVALVLLYPAFSFALLGAAYGGLGPRVFLKRASGRQHLAVWLPFGPYLALTTLAYWLYLLFSKEPAYAAAAPNLFFGRRLTPHEAREAQCSGWRSVLDLAAEFTEVEGLRMLPDYRSLPILDGTAPTLEQFREAAKWIEESLARGPVYIHCALGHGRTSTLVIGYLLASGKLAAVEDGLKQLRAVRPGVKVDPRQEVFLKRLALARGVERSHLR